MNSCQLGQAPLFIAERSVGNWRRDEGCGAEGVGIIPAAEPRLHSCRGSLLMFCRPRCNPSCVTNTFAVLEPPRVEGLLILLITVAPASISRSTVSIC